MKKEMLINVLQPEECRIAIVEDGVLEELYVERTSLENYTGNIYKGRVVNIEPAIQAAFVDFSVGRNGFLHVSDVEPHYYRTLLGDQPELSARDRGREPRPTRSDEPRRGDRDEPRSSRGSAPPYRASDDVDEPRSHDWDRDRDRDRDRPDRSEKDRRDRSARRFGEGLTEEDDSPPSPPPPPRPVPPSRRPIAQAAPPEPEPRPAVPTPDIESDPIGWSPRRPTEAERTPPRPTPPQPPPAPRGRLPRPVDPIESELPPNRAQRSSTRPAPPASEPPRRHESEAEREDAPSPRRSDPDLDFREREEAAEPVREPRRGRGRPSAPPRSSDAAEALPDNDFEAPSVPGPDDQPEPPRRRSGRAAIRARGGDRPQPPERREPVKPRAETPDVDFEAPVAEPPRPRETERIRPTEPPPARERGRSRERDRDRDRDRDRGRSSGTSRAGEPGYVPRRERTRDLDPPEFEPEPPMSRSWSDVKDDERDDLEPLGPDDEGHDELGDEGEKGDRPRRRRRRRRRGGTDRPARENEGDPTREEIEAQATTEFELDAGYEPATDTDVEHTDDFDDEIEPEDDVESARPTRGEDDRIDPELEEEIRREIEEIAELERDLGLRGGVEPRPRRPDEREAAARLYRGRGAAKPPIQDVFKRGDEVLVQVIKESIGTKGPTLSTYISIPGRYLVLMPGLNRVGVSRKIADEGQRRKLREIMNDLNPPKGLGFIVRTAGLDRSKRDLARDLAYLLRLWKVILKRVKKARSPAPIYQESDMITRTIRDVFTADIDTIWIDEPAAFERAQEFLRVVMPRFVDRIKFYDEKVPLFHKYGIEEEIAKIQRRRVDLPEGGSIVIDQTEALVAIDVNSGNFRVEDDAERTAYEMNLRAAKEIARQLRLRDLGGVIVNDFIDMRDERHRRGVERAIRDAMKRDRARTKILRMSQFGLVQMTRQRIRPSLKRSVYEDCNHCKGAAVVKTVESMSIDVMRLLALAAHKPEIRRINVCVSSAVATYLNNRKRPEITRLEGEGGLTIYVHHEENVPAEHLQLDCFDAHGGEVRVLPAPPPAHPRRGR